MKIFFEILSFHALFVILNEVNPVNIRAVLNGEYESASKEVTYIE